MKYFIAALILIFTSIFNMENSFSDNSKTILAFGDSLTAGFGLSIDESYPSILENKLKENGYNYRVVNAGFSGDTTHGGLLRIKWSMKVKPDIVILELGANDSMRGIPAKEAKENLSKIIEIIMQEKSEILFVGMKAPRNTGKSYYEEFDKIYPELSSKYKLHLIPFFLEGIARKPEYNLGDGIHPNYSGYKFIVDKNIWKYLLPILKKNQGGINAR